MCGWCCRWRLQVLRTLFQADALNPRGRRSSEVQMLTAPVRPIYAVATQFFCDGIKAA